MFLVRVSEERCSNNCGCQLLKLSISASQGALGVRSNEIACPACSGIWEILQSAPLTRSAVTAAPIRSTATTTSSHQLDSVTPKYNGGDYGNAIKGQFTREDHLIDETSNSKLCKCGLPVVSRTVVKAGPNTGKKYFSCSKNRYSTARLFDIVM